MTKYAKIVSDLAGALSFFLILFSVIGFVATVRGNGPMAIFSLEPWGILFSGLFGACILLLLDAILKKGSDKTS